MCVNDTLPIRVRRRWLLMMLRLTSSSFAGTVRTDVAVGTARLASMFSTMRAPTPRKGLTSSLAAITGAGSGALAGPSTFPLPFRGAGTVGWLEPPESDIAFLLDSLGSALREPLYRDDVVGAFAGLRPLLDDGTERSADVSRRHHIATSPDGVVTAVGGKLTAYRQMAQDAVDAALRRRGIQAQPCRTRTLPLVGAAPRAVLSAIDAPSTLVRRYGTEAPAVAALAAAEGLDTPVAEDVIQAELVWALRHEGALTVDDLLDRRTRIGLVPADRAAALPRAEALFSAYR